MRPQSKKAGWLRELEEAGEIERAKTLDDRPQFVVGASWIWAAFSVLSESRTYHFSGMPGAIPLTEVEAYCRLRDVTDQRDRDLLVRCIRSLDAKFIELASEERDKRDKQQTGKPANGGRR